MELQYSHSCNDFRVEPENLNRKPSNCLTINASML